ncbi:DNA cytosine methyltransferase [Pedobacter sp. UC225_61]|uniref:DNA cytosine methyltransferase n=1 Tax=Pedobacter sp. UC225_61 TaxID=3374623 RepID=UPI0037B3C3BB
MENKRIPIIDLFAGPGGLAEGFSSLVDDKNNRFFNIKLSIEKDSHACETLKLRSFVRQFPFKQLPEQYYEFLQKKISIETLYKTYPDETVKAEAEAWQATLGETAEEEIDKRISDGLEGEKNWVLIGGPPCQAYSLVGRSRVGGIDKDDHRVELYKEYLRIIAVHQPAVFVMENVKGLLSAKVDDIKIFDNILADLKDPSSIFPETKSIKYKIHSLVKPTVKFDTDYLIKSEKYGIPQKRHRVILLGIREDIDVLPTCLEETGNVNLGITIGDLPKVRSGLYREFVSSEEVFVKGILKKKRNYKPVQDSQEAWLKLIICYANELNKLLPDNFRDNTNHPKTIGSEYLQEQTSVEICHPLHDWFTDKKIEGTINHQSRGHLTLDLKRYLFSSLYTRKFKKFPRMDDYRAYGEDLLPDHLNAESGKFNDRFRVQLPNEPATTITSHISKDGHYFIHYDPIQCRSLTVREAARIQTFPDNYFFCGSRTQQFHQVGNAVPPYLAFQIADVVKDLIIKALIKPKN